MLSSYSPSYPCAHTVIQSHLCVDPYAELYGTRDFLSLLELVGRHNYSFLRGQLMVMEDDNRRQLLETNAERPIMRTITLSRH
jgi:hypothetical protein